MRYTLHTSALTTVALLGFTNAAIAQDPSHPSDKQFTVLLGTGVVMLPKYAGSDEYRVLPMPIAQIEYRGRLFLGGSPSGVGGGIGAYVVRNQSLTWDVTLAGAEGRNEKRGDALAGMGRRSAASYASSGVAYRRGSIIATAGGAIGLGKDEGSYATVGLTSEHTFAQRWVGGISSGATFADSRNMSFDFGVTDQQAATRRALIASGDLRLRAGDGAAFAPKGGLKELRSGVSLAYLMTPRTRAMFFSQGARLSDEAARSSLVRRRNSLSTGVGMAYAF